MSSALKKVVVFALFALTAATLFGQEALREAAAVPRAQAARAQALNRDEYNLRAGPVLLRFDATMGFEYNDNPTLVDKAREEDFMVRPQINMASSWPISKNNTLSLAVGLGYIKYFNNRHLDHVLIAPSSELSFDLYVGNVAVNLHDRVSHTQEAINDPTVSGTGEFSAIENAAGLRLDWDLNKIVLSFGYDHFNYISTGSGLSNGVDRSSELFYGRAAYQVNTAVRTGVEMGGGLTTYEKEVFNNNTHYSAGLFVESQMSMQSRLRASAGYVQYNFDEGGTLGNTEDTGGFYGDLTADHLLTQFMNHSLSIGRQSGAGTATDFYTLLYVRYQNNWNVFQRSVLRSLFFYEWGDSSGGIKEEFRRYGASLAISYPVARKLTASLGYQFLLKDSDEPERDYVQNRILLDMTYAF